MVDQYLDYLRSVRNLSENTIRAYSRDISLLNGFLQHREYEEGDTRFARAFVGSLSKQGLSSRSINRILSAVRGYFRFIQKFDGVTISADPFSGVKGLKLQRKLPPFLFEEEADKILSENGSRFCELRNQAIFEFLYSTGCRVSEAVALNITDLDLKEGVVRVVGKGRRERMVFIGKKARGILKSYLMKRQYAIPRERRENALFVNAKGRRLGARGVRYLLSRRLKEIDFNRPVTPHTFRHSFATHSYENGMRTFTLKKLLGHEYLGTTETYLYVQLGMMRKSTGGLIR